ncbi:unnamed protein product [Rotaria sp. Silwood2]|nr:unnamed protein product [Rotaria sp. Silwood2]
MTYTGVGERAAQSFGYILTEMPLLKYLTLQHSQGIDPITYIPSTVVNDTIVSLTIWLFNVQHLIPFLYRFQKLSMLTMCMYDNAGIPMKRAVPPQNIQYYRSQLREKTSMEYPATLRHIKVYQYPLVVLENMEK